MNTLVKAFLSLLLFCPSTWAGLDFDDTDDAVDCGADSSLTDIFASGGTVYIRFKLDNYTAVLDRDITKDLWGLRHQTTTQYEFYAEFTGGVANWGTTSNVVTTGTIHTIIVTYNSSSATNDPTIYVDGSAMTLGYDNNKSGTYVSDSGANLYLGNTGVSSDRCLDGQIYEVALWNTVISAQNIAQLAKSNTRRVALQTSPANLKGYWELDSVAGGSSADAATFQDLSGNGNTCTADNGANNTGMTALSEPQMSYP